MAWTIAVLLSVLLYGISSAGAFSELTGYGLADDVTDTEEKVGQMRSLLVYPGTKWCGPGNRASTYEHLGKYNLTDACCREHDYCNATISRFRHKYYYYNLRPYKLSHCDCDMTFYNCLKEVNTKTSRRVGKWYFNRLKMKCFIFKERRVCLKRRFLYLGCKRRGQRQAAISKHSPRF